MKSFGLMINTRKDGDLASTKSLIKTIQDANQKVCISRSFQDICSDFITNVDFFDDDNSLIQNSDILVSLGGDGTFLKAARKIFGKKTPIVGINLGNLGFLAEIDNDDISKSINRIISDDYFTENRMVLEISVTRKDKIVSHDYALNDAILTAKNTPKMLHVNTYINNIFLEYLPCDGVIISSPTGSTAYSLSAGGPLVEPDVDMIIISPICPHTLFSRPCITSAERVVTVALAKSCTIPAVLTVDGQNSIDIRPNDIINIKKANFPLTIIRLNPENFFEVLRSKIYLRGEKNKKYEI